MKFKLKLLATILVTGTWLVACPVLIAQQIPSLGFIVPLSGDAASIGDAVKNGAELAYSELSPEVRTKFDLAFEDDRMSPKNAVSAFISLRTKKNLAAVIAVSSGIAHAIAPLAESNHLPFIGIGVSDSKVAKDRQYTFLHWITPEVQVKAILNELEKRKLYKIAVVYASQEGYIALRDTFKTLTIGTGFTIVFEEEIPQGEQDFSPYVVRLNRANEIEAVFSALMPGQNAQFAKKLRQSSSKIQFIGGEVIDNPDEQAAAGSAFNGAFYATPAEATETFITSYKSKFPKSSLFTAANGYDSVKLFASYIESSKDRSQFDSFLRNLKNFSGACGNYSYSEGGKFSLPVQVKTL